MSAGNADKEGHSNLQFLVRLTLGVRFRLRVESNASNIELLLDYFVTGHGDH